MTTFNDLTKGVNSNQSFYIASVNEAIQAISNDKSANSYYIVKSRIGLQSLEVYLNLKAIPNGIAVNGKVYEGKSKNAAIAALKEIN